MNKPIQFVRPDTCPKCGSKDITDYGLGTEKLEQIIKETFNINKSSN